MKLRIFLFSLLFIYNLPVGMSFAQDKVVVVPLFKELDVKSIKALCVGYDKFLGEPPPARFNCPPKLVFVSSIGFNGDLGGVNGADAKCQALADASRRTAGRIFRAWISTTASVTPNTKFHKSQVQYRLVNGELVANDYSDLTDGSIIHPINITEKGAQITSTKVWTCTEADGTASSGCEFSIDRCLTWGSNYPGNTARYGMASNTDTTWSGDPSQLDSCDEYNLLYCFEQ